MMLRFVLGLCLLVVPHALSASSLQTSAGPVLVTQIMDDLSEPWGLDFLPGGGFVVTERQGNLVLVTADGKRRDLGGVPKVVAKGQGGLLDVAVARDFATSRELFLSYAKAQGRGAGTALAIARLSQDESRLEDVRVIFEMSPGSSGGRHYGSRIIEMDDGTLFLTLGERGEDTAAQDLARHNGSVIRINRDGTVPSDNPFVGSPGALAHIWSYGHRNPQGAALDHKGRLWVNEHGAKGGDEINRIEKGANYGWPVITYGVNYNGKRIGVGTRAPGMEQPAHYWDPSIAPSGLMIYSGKLWPEWKGDFFSGSLKLGFLSRLDPNAGWSEERIHSRATARVRDVIEAPDGSIWFISVGRRAIYRMSPG